MLSKSGVLFHLLLSPVVALADVLYYETTPNGFNAPQRGWNSFALQASSNNFQFNQEGIIQQCDAMRQKLGQYGYEYCSLDSGWSLPYDGDEYGRITYDPSLFDIPALAQHLHGNGAKLGVYILPGFFSNDVNKIIIGTNITLDSIKADEENPCRAMARCNIDYKKPGAQEWCNSNIQQFADWGVDFIKLDYVTPGSPDSNADLSPDNSGSVECYHQAIQKVGRPMRLDISWKLEKNSTYYDIWKANADSMRTDQDLNNSGESTLVRWQTVQRAIEQYRQHILLQADRGAPLTVCPDLDNLLVANAADLTGLTDLERTAVRTHWIGAGANLVLGSDLTRINDFGMALLGNAVANEVAAFTARFPMVPTLGNDDRARGKQRQVWVAGPDPASGVGVVVLANYAAGFDDTLFDPAPEGVAQVFELSPRDLGFAGAGSYAVDDVWASSQMQLAAEERHRWTLGTDGSAILLRFTPSSSATPASNSSTKRGVAEPQAGEQGTGTATMTSNANSSTPSTTSTTSTRSSSSSTTTTTSSRIIILQTQPATPIESPTCYNDHWLNMPGNLSTADGPQQQQQRVTPLTLMYRLRDMLCTNTCAAPVGVDTRYAAVYASGGDGDTCEISVGVSAALEAYAHRDAPALGVERAQCWASTAHILEQCVASGVGSKGWWNGDHAYQFYELGVRRRNDRDSLHVKSAGQEVAAYLPSYTGPVVYGGANATTPLFMPSLAAEASAASATAMAGRAGGGDAVGATRSVRSTAGSTTTPAAASASSGGGVPSEGPAGRGFALLCLGVAVQALFVLLL